MSEKEKLLKKLIGQKILEARQANSVNQEEFAFRIGIHKNSLSRIERGVYTPKGITFIRMITEWNVDVTKLVQEANLEVKRIFPDNKE